MHLKSKYNIKMYKQDLGLDNYRPRDNKKNEENLPHSGLCHPSKLQSKI